MLISPGKFNAEESYFQMIKFISANFEIKSN